MAELGLAGHAALAAAEIQIVQGEGPNFSTELFGGSAEKSGDCGAVGILPGLPSKIAICMGFLFLPLKITHVSSGRW